MSVERQESMRAVSVMRVALFGAVGFGIWWTLLGVFGGGFAIADGVGLPMFGAIFSGDFLALLVYALLFSVGGAFGGALLGLGLRNRRKAAVMALLGAVAFFVGSFIVTILYFFFSFFFGAGYGLLETASAAALGLVVGAALGLFLRSWKSMAVLALMGLVGFGIGGVIAAALQGFPLQPSEALPSWQSAVFGAIEGLIGGASLLGAALGYLEKRRLTEGQRPRVR
jgi:MFS family permease